MDSKQNSKKKSFPFWKHSSLKTSFQKAGALYVTIRVPDMLAIVDDYSRRSDKNKTQLFWKAFLMYSGRLLTAVVMWFAAPAVIAHMSPVLPPPPIIQCMSIFSHV